MKGVADIVANSGRTTVGGRALSERTLKRAEAERSHPGGSVSKTHQGSQSTM